MRAHGIASNAATIKPAPARNLKAESKDSIPNASSSSPTAKKRKADPYLEDTPARDDEEGFGTIKSEGFGTVKSEPAVTIKEQFVVKEEVQHRQQEQQPQPGQLSLGEAANLMQYYDTPTQYAGMGMAIDDGYSGEYSTSQTYGTSMSGSDTGGSSSGDIYGMGSQQPYSFSAQSSYGGSGMGGMNTSEPQMLSYRPRMQYSSDGQGRADSPVIVE